MFSLQTSTRRTWRASTMGLSASCWVATVGPCSPSPLLPNNFLLPNLLPTLLPRPPHSCWACWLSLLHLSRSGLKTFLAEVTFPTQTVSKVFAKKGRKECKKWAKKWQKPGTCVLAVHSFCFPWKPLLSVKVGVGTNLVIIVPLITANLSVSLLLLDSGKRGRVAFLWEMMARVDEEASLALLRLLRALFMTFSLLSFTNRLDLFMWGDRECLEPTQYWKVM